MIDVKLLYPIGSIYMSIQDTNPSVFFGGTWERIAKGKTLVGVDENDSDFNSSSKTGGEKEHTLTIAEMPAHNHNTDKYYDTGIGANNFYGSNATGNHYTNPNGMSNAGGGQAHNNLQPYYTCYIFVRTA